MPDPTNNPPAPVPAGAAPQKSGSSALKIVLIIVGIFVVLGMLVVGVIGYGFWRISRAVHKSANGQVTVSTLGGAISANTTQAVTAGDLGVAIYPGATQGKGTLHMTIAGKSMVTANFLTPDPKDKVIAFYKDQAGPNAEVMTTDTGGYINVNKGNDSITITILQQANQNNGETQITIVHTSGS